MSSLAISNCRNYFVSWPERFGVFQSAKKGKPNPTKIWRFVQVYIILLTKKSEAIFKN